MIERLIFPRESWLKVIRSFYVCMNEFFFKFKRDLWFKTWIKCDSWTISFCVGYRGPSCISSSVPLVSLSDYMDVRKRFFFPFCCLRLRNRIFLLAPWRTIDSLSDKNFHQFFPILGVHARTTRVLLFMVIPGNLIFLYTIRVLQAGHTTLTLMFTSGYLLAGLIQVFVN